MRFDDLFQRYASPMAPIPSGLSFTGTLHRPLKAMLFDVYGTLFISGSGDIAVARRLTRGDAVLQALLKEFDVQLTPDELLETFYKTIENHHHEKRQAGIAYPEVEIQEIWGEVLTSKDDAFIQRFALAFELIVNPTYPMPHLNELLAAAVRSELTLGIISNAQFYTPLLFAHFCGNPPQQMGFDYRLLIYSYVLGEAKPSPRLFERAVEQLASANIDPGEALFVGNDMLNDIYPAAHVGFQTALFAGDLRSLRMRRTDPRCRRLSPDLIITDLLELASLLESITA